MASFSERWRYKRAGLLTPRARDIACARGAGSPIIPLDSDDDADDWVPDETFPEVPCDLIQRSAWKLLYATRLYGLEAIQTRS